MNKKTKGTSCKKPSTGSDDRRKKLDSKKSTLVKTSKATSKKSTTNKKQFKGDENWEVVKDVDGLIKCLDEKDIQDQASNRLVTQKEFAMLMGVSPAYITNLKNKGIFDICFKNKKLVLSCAEKQYIANSDPTRDAQRDAVALKKGSYEQDIFDNTPPEVADDEEVFTENNIKQLNKYIKAANTPSQKVQIIKDFWTGKLNEQKYLIEDEKLISVETIVSENQKILKVVRDNFLAMKSKLAPMLLGVDDIIEIETILEREIHNILDALSQMRGCDV